MRILLFLMLILLACHSENTKVVTVNEEKAAAEQPKADEPKTIEVEPLRDSLIIPNDLFSPSRKDEQTFWFPDDTLTVRGNYVRYLITRDSCCLDNTYIQWGNDTIKRLEIAQAVRAFRTYFTPTLLAESKDYLILWHGCATECQALLFLPLNTYEKPRDIMNFVCYDQNTSTVVCGLENYKQETDHQFLETINVKTGKKKSIRFKNRKMATVLTQLIDSCRITDQFIYIRARLFNDKTQKDVMEEAKLKNDLW